MSHFHTEDDKIVHTFSNGRECQVLKFISGSIYLNSLARGCLGWKPNVSKLCEVRSRKPSCYVMCAANHFNSSISIPAPLIFCQTSHHRF